MDSQYLKENIGDVLAAGLTDVVLVNPEDPVSYLGEWLLHHISLKEQSEVTAQKRESALQQDANTQHIDEQTIENNAHAAEQHAEKSASDEQAVLSFLTQANNYEGLLQKVAQIVCEKTKVKNSYIYQLVNDTTLKVVAANQDFLLGQELVKPNDDEEVDGKGVTFRIFDEVEEANEGEDDDNFEGSDNEAENEVSGDKQKKEERFLYVEDVLTDPKSSGIKFFDLPQSGSYFAIRVRYNSSLNNDAIDSALREEEVILSGGKSKYGKKKGKRSDEDSSDETEETDAPEDLLKEDEVEDVATDVLLTDDEKAQAARKKADEEAKELDQKLLAAITLKEESFVFAVDTLGQYKRLTNEQINLFKTYSSALGETLERIDRSLFREERIRRAALNALNNRLMENEDDTEAKRIASEEMVETLNKDELPASADDVSFQLCKSSLLKSSSKKYLINEFGKFFVFWGPINVVEAFLYLLGYTSDNMIEQGQSPSWNKMRTMFNEDLVTHIEQFDPRSEDFKISVKQIQKLIRGISVNDLKEKNYPLSEMLAFIHAALSLKNLAEDERKMARMEAEADMKRVQEEEMSKTETEESEYNTTDATETETDVTETETDVTETETDATTDTDY